MSASSVAVLSKRKPRKVFLKDKDIKDSGAINDKIEQLRKSDRAKGTCDIERILVRRWSSGGYFEVCSMPPTSEYAGGCLPETTPELVEPDSMIDVALLVLREARADLRYEHYEESEAHIRDIREALPSLIADIKQSNPEFLRTLSDGVVSQLVLLGMRSVACWAQLPSYCEEAPPTR